MSLVRFTVRNEYGLGRPELYGCDGREDPQEILNGVAVAGLVGILRQLGDLSEFAAEIFQGLQEEVMMTASRSHRLMSRVRNIEDTLPALERQLLAQTSHIHLAYTSGHGWHPNLVNKRNHFINNDLPRCIMDSYEECNDPPSFYLLDKFDPGSPGTCLRRYSDPTFFKRASERRSGVNDEVQRDTKNHKNKKKRVSQRNLDVSRLVSMSNQSSRSQIAGLSFNGRISSSQIGSAADTASKSDLGENSDFHDSERGSGPTEYNLDPSMKHEDNLSNKSSSSWLSQRADTNASVHSDVQSEVVNGYFSSRPSQEEAALGAACVNWDEKAEILGSEYQQFFCTDALEKSCRNQPDEIEKQQEAINQVKVERESEIERELEIQSKPDMDIEQETESEGEIFVDAPYSIELESESDREYNAKLVVEQKSSNMKKYRADQESNETKQVVEHDDNGVEDDVHNQEYGQATLAASDIHKDQSIPCSLSEKVTSEFLSDERMLQVTRSLLELNNSSGSDFGANADVLSCSNGASGIISTNLSNPGVQISGTPNSLSIDDKQSPCETQFEALHGFQSVKMWTNGCLLGLEPSKPSTSSKFSVPDDTAEITANSPLKACTERVDRIVENEVKNPSSSSYKFLHSSASTDACDGELCDFQEKVIEDSYLHKSSFDWFTSSPPLEHMKISFSPAEGLNSPRLKLKFPHGFQSHESGKNQFPAFQLVPDPEVSLNEAFSDSDDDTFCRSSPYVSDDYPTENDSQSNSEQWEEESDDSPEKRDPERHDTLHEIPTPASVSGSLTVDCNRCMLAEDGLQPSHAYPSIDSPSFAAWNPALQKETEDGFVPNRFIKLQRSKEPDLPPLPPVQWRVSRTPSDRIEEKQQALRDELEHAFGQKISLSADLMESQVPSVDKEQSDVCSTPPNSENKVQQKLKSHDDRNVNGKDTDWKISCIKFEPNNST